MAADPVFPSNPASTGHVDQENSNIFVKAKQTKQMKSIFEDENSLLSNGNEVVFGTPRAKIVNSLPRKVLGEKTPNNSKRTLLSLNSTSPTKTPSQLNNSLNLTPPLIHPTTLENISVATKTLSNPPDLFLQPQQKRRSVRHSKPNDNELIKEASVKSNQKQALHQKQVTTKLVTVFPSASDELDSEEFEIEKPAGGKLGSDENDDNSLDCLSGTSTIIPNLELHENLDFTRILSINNNNSLEEPEKEIKIEPVFVDFIVKEGDEEE